MCVCVLSQNEGVRLARVDPNERCPTSPRAFFGVGDYRLERDMEIEGELNTMKMYIYHLERSLHMCVCVSVCGMLQVKKE